MKIQHKLFYSIFLMLFAVSAQAQLDRSKAPKPSAAPEIHIGDYQSFTLENGLKVFLVENHQLPQVSFNLSIDRDPIRENESVGVSSMAGQMLAYGTSTRTKAQIDDEVDFIGARLNTHSKGVYAFSLSKHAEKTFSLLADVLLHPVFPAEELEKLKTQAYSGLANQKSSPDAISKNVSHALCYGLNHPYGETETEETVKNISVEKCKAYYNTFFKPNISYLVIVGDIKLKAAKKLVKSYLGKWKKGDVPTFKYDMPKQPVANRLAFVNKAGAVQSVIKIIYPIDLKPGSPDAIKVSVMNAILGGGIFSGRLMQNLREDKAFTYGARSSIDSDPLVGYFSAGAKVKNQVTDSAIVEFLYEMQRIVDEPVSEEDLKMTINLLTGMFALQLEEPRTIARFALNTARYNLPKDYYTNYLKKLSQITVADVQAMAKKYIKPKNAIIVVVGSKDEVSGKLSRFGTNNQVEFFDIFGKPIQENTKKLPEGLTAQDVVNKYITAIGGAKKLKKVKSFSMSALMPFPGAPTAAVMARYHKENMYVNSLSMGGNVMQKQVFDGKKAQESSMRGSRMLEGDDLKAIKEDAAIFQVLKYLDKGYKIELKSIETINGKDAYAVHITFPSGKKQTDFFDVKSGLKVKQIEFKETSRGVMEQAMEISDYKEISGILFPHTMQMSVGGQSLKISVQNIAVNPKLKDDLFKIKK